MATIENEGHTVKLEHPIPVKREGGGTVMTNELRFPPRLQVKHLKSMPDSLFESDGKNVSPKDMILFIGALTGLPEETVDEIDATDDLPRIAEALNSFFGPKVESPLAAVNGTAP